MTNKNDALPVVASEPCIECWSCHVPVTLNERAECDGECPHCSSELDLDDYLGTAVFALAELRAVSDACSNSLADKCREVVQLQAELAALREQEPIYQTYDGVTGWLDVDRVRYTACCLSPEEYETRVVYAAPLVSDKAGAVCATCDGNGAVGNILTAEPCPDCCYSANPLAADVAQGEGEKP